MSVETWRTEFPDLRHEPQDLDLIRVRLSWTPRERLENLKRVHAFIARARAGKWHPPLGARSRRAKT
ncbi:MAG TPA: hypothetical protein VF395_18905 [Polyangiaceae bacterium]